MKPRDIRVGDTITLEVEVLKTWEDGRLTFHLSGHESPITISADSGEIVQVAPTSPSRTKH